MCMTLSELIEKIYLERSSENSSKSKKQTHVCNNCKKPINEALKDSEAYNIINKQFGNNKIYLCKDCALELVGLIKTKMRLYNYINILKSEFKKATSDYKIVEDIINKHNSI